MSQHWTDAQTSKLIQFYERNPQLWNKKIVDYRKPVRSRSETIKEIALKLNKTEKEIAAKWHKLTFSYQRIQRRIERKNGNVELAKLNWIHWSEMQFLKTLDNTTDVQSSTNDFSLVEFDDPVMNEIPVPTPFNDDHQQPAPQSSLSLHTSLTNTSSSPTSSNNRVMIPVEISSHHQLSTECTDKENLAFLTGLAPSLRPLRGNFLVKAKMEIYQVIYRIYQEQMKA